MKIQSIGATVFLFASALLSSSSFALVTPEQALRAFTGKYIVNSANLGKLEFEILSDGSAKFVDPDEESQIRGELQRFDHSKIGPKALPVLNVAITQANGEDTGNLLLRVAPIFQEGTLKLQFMDALFTHNDGPNNSSYSTLENTTRLYKKDSKNKLRELPKVL